METDRGKIIDGRWRFARANKPIQIAVKRRYTSDCRLPKEVTPLSKRDDVPSVKLIKEVADSLEE